MVVARVCGILLQRPPKQLLWPPSTFVDCFERAQMRPDVTVVGDGFAARVAPGVGASQPLSAGDVEWLVGLLHKYKVLVLSGQNTDSFTPTALERFSNHFGAPTPHPSRATRLPGCDAIQVLRQDAKGDR